MCDTRRSLALSSPLTKTPHPTRRRRSKSSTRTPPKTSRTMRRPLVTAAAMFASAAIWAGIASSTTTYADSSAIVLGAGILVVVSVAIVGMVAGSARWALRMGIAVSSSMIALGVVFPLSMWSGAGMALAGIAVAGLGGTAFDPLIKQRSSADGPPARAVVLPLLLLVAPPIWAVSAPEGLGVATLLAVALSWICAVWYMKALPGALTVVRFALPVGFAIAVPPSGIPLGLLIGLTGVGATALAWSVDARIAVHPLAEPGTTVPIPPELAPRDILDAAGIDDRGRRKEDGA